MNLKGFQEQKVLGQGTYGCVYKAKRLSDGKSYAVKVVNLSKLNHREIEDSVNEIRLMASFTSPFIIQFYEAFCDNKRLCIVTEYSRLGDLAHLIERRKKKRRPFQEEDIWRFLIQLLSGLKELHSCGVVHRDLKSANILLSAPDWIKIADLGVSTVLHTRQLARTQIGTPLYLAPEVWKRRPYDQHCDMWSLGVLLYEMMTFTFPFLGRTTEELSRRVCLGRFSAPRGYSPDLISIVRKLLQVNPMLRPTVTELLNTQCIKSRMSLVNDYLNPAVEKVPDHLLSTIKVPQNVKNVNLPSAAYGKKPDIIRPIEQRMHMKKGIGLKKDIGSASSPELQLIMDLDWWSPNKVQLDNPEKETQIKQENDFQIHPPAPKPPSEPHNPPGPRRIHGKACVVAHEIPNPRFRRMPMFY